MNCRRHLWLLLTHSRKPGYHDPFVVKMAVCEVSFGKNYAVLTMKSGENRFNIDFLKQLNKSLDEVESNKDVLFLITVGDGKFYSNGLDVAFLSECTTDEMLAVFSGMVQTFVRILTFPVPTIAAINGHVFAAGALLALTHDYRVMRTQRGWFCFPEVHLRFQFGKGNLALLRQKIRKPQVLTDAVLMGKRFVAEEAMAANLVDKICGIEQLLSTAVQLGQETVGAEGFDRSTLKLLKSNLYSDVLEAFELTDQVEDRLIGQFQRKSNL